MQFPSTPRSVRAVLKFLAPWLDPIFAFFNLTSEQSVKLAIVSGACLLLYWGLYLPLAAYGGLVPALVIASTIYIGVKFLLQRKWVFAMSDPKYLIKKMTLFVGWETAYSIVNGVAVPFLVWKEHFAANVAQAMMSGIMILISLVIVPRIHALGNPAYVKRP